MICWHWADNPTSRGAQEATGAPARCGGLCNIQSISLPALPACPFSAPSQDISDVAGLRLSCEAPVDARRHACGKNALMAIFSTCRELAHEKSGKLFRLTQPMRANNVTIPHSKSGVGPGSVQHFLKLSETAETIGSRTYLQLSCGMLQNLQGGCSWLRWQFQCGFLGFLRELHLTAVASRCKKPQISSV